MHQGETGKWTLLVFFALWCYLPSESGHARHNTVTLGPIVVRTLNRFKESWISREWLAYIYEDCPVKTPDVLGVFT